MAGGTVTILGGLLALPLAEPDCYLMELGCREGVGLAQASLDLVVDGQDVIFAISFENQYLVQLV